MVGGGAGIAVGLATGAAGIAGLVFAVDDRILDFVGFFDGSAALVECAGDEGAGVGEEQRFTAAHGARDVCIGGQEADVFDFQLEKSPGNGAELERGGIAGVAAAGLVDNEFEIVGSGLLPDDFDDGLGVGDGGGLRGGDDEGFAGGDGELNDLGADAGDVEEEAPHGLAFEVG